MTPDKDNRLVVGIIAEDKSDFLTIKSIIHKIPCQHQLVLKTAYGKGCGRIRSKCRKMVADLKRKHCESLIIVHDLDDYEISSLKNTIISALEPCEVTSHVIIIPVRAIEAWLLSDMQAIQETFSYTYRIREIPNTETIHKPKKHLRDLVTNRMKKRYLNTVHNEKIANNISIEKILKCPSFHPLYDFVRSI